MRTAGSMAVKAERGLSTVKTELVGSGGDTQHAVKKMRVG